MSENEDRSRQGSEPPADLQPSNPLVPEEEEPAKEDAPATSVSFGNSPSSAFFESPEQAPGDPGQEQRLKVLRCYTLSRVLETVRYKIAPEELDTVVTKSGLAKVLNRDDPTLAPLHHHNEHKGDNATVKGKNHLSTSFTDVEEEELEEFWLATQAGSHNATFRELLKFGSGTFPITHTHQREQLKKISKNYAMVRRETIEKEVDFGDLSDPKNQLQKERIMNFLFHSGCEAIAGEIFQDLVGSLEYHPITKTFPYFFCSVMVKSGRRMMTLLPYFVLVLVTLIQVPYVAGMPGNAAVRTVIHFLEADWAAGCPHGRSDVRGCNFIQRNLNQIETVEFDALRYFRNELISRLWTADGRSAADTPIGYHAFPPAGSIGSVYPIGGLLLRLSPENDNTDSRNRFYSCADLNISVMSVVHRIDAEYDCSASWSTVIPFNATTAEALAMASTATTTLRGNFGDSALIAQFAFMQPQSGLFGYAKITLSLPVGGHVVTRIEANTIDYKGHTHILPMLIISSVLVFISIVFGVFFRQYGQPLINGDLIGDIVAYILLCVAYSSMANLDRIDAYQISHIEANTDRISQQYLQGCFILGFWALLVIASSIRYLREFGVLHIVVGIVSHAALEIAAMVAIFSLWTFTFALIARMFFGTIDMSFASAFSTFRVMFGFFQGKSSFDDLEAAHPVLGPLYWFAFLLFVTFFALNLLIAVLTSPLQQVKDSSNLHEELHALVQADVEAAEHLTSLDHFKHKCRDMFLSLVNIVFDASPAPPNKLHWLNLFEATRQLARARNTKIVMKAGIQFLSELQKPCKSEGRHANPNRGKNLEVPYNTRLACKVAEIGCFDKISCAFVLQSLAFLSSNNVVRDARLEKALMQYDLFTTDINNLQGVQETSELHAKQLSMRKEDEGSENKEADPTATLVTLPECFEVKENVALREENLHGAAETQDPNDPMFLFTKTLLRRLKKSRIEGLRFFITLLLFIIFFVLGFSTNTTSAYLAMSAHQGLRDFPIHQECWDGECAAGFSFRKTWMDTGDLADFYVWIDKVLHRQLFLPPKFNRSAQSVLWDNRTTFDLPITFRQVRGAPKQCEFPSLSSTAPAGLQQRYKYMFDNLKCTVRSQFDTSPIKVPNASSISWVNLNHQDRCAERRNLPYLGYFSPTYPCRGYIATVNSSEELSALMASGWFSTEVRLIVITMILRTPLTALEYDLYLELDEGGGTTYPFAYAVDISLRDKNTYITMLVLGLIAVSIDAILEIMFAVYTFVVGCGKKVAFKFTDVITVKLVVVYLLVFAVPYAFYHVDAVNERLWLQVSICALLLVYNTTNVVFFPMVGLLSKQGMNLFATFSRALVELTKLLPFYIIFLLAMAYAGMLLFSNRSEDFAELRWAILRVCRFALGDTDFNSLSNVQPEVTEVYNLIFYAVVLIMLANLVLAMVTSAAGDVLAIDMSVDLVTRVAKANKNHIFYGEIFTMALAWNHWWISVHQKSADSADVFRLMRAVLTADGSRLWYLPEAIVSTLGPHRANDVLEHLKMDQVADVLYPSAIVWITEQHSEFKKQNPVLEVKDEKLESEELKKHGATRRMESSEAADE